ncbi:DUF5131 family protein [Parablautia sp. Marseille-Q6255]|uniref:DUF5131 family protein n=1 Tax=Parablautia sp. Marseille-Q6255 TaxID=3039593 RepID=UPI0024BD2DFB|nr:DUF5131 family protein [Parablautia sp. Marseille-Q6255]
MNRSKIRWCDHTFNIITGCQYGCSYCYAAQMALRFCGNVKQNLAQKHKYRMDGDLFILDKPFLSEDGYQIIYPFGFKPTLHRYRYDILDKLKQGQNILVGAMADLFGEWVSDYWIKDIFEICEKKSQHNYMFLTKNPERYTKYGVPDKENMWYGTTITNDEDVKRIHQLPSRQNTFVTVEPILENINIALADVKWIIVGAETGYRAGRIIPEFDWIRKIVDEADRKGIPIFMQDSLIGIVGEENMRRELPVQLQIHKRSEKVNARLQGNCMLCGIKEDKNQMVTLSGKTIRRGKTIAFGHMCHSCFKQWLNDHNIPVPALEGLYEENSKGDE